MTPKLPPGSLRSYTNYGHPLLAHLCFSPPSSWMIHVVHLVYSLLPHITSMALPLLTLRFSSETLPSPLPSNCPPFLQSLWRFSWLPHSKRAFSFPWWNSLEFTVCSPTVSLLILLFVSKSQVSLNLAQVLEDDIGGGLILNSFSALHWSNWHSINNVDWLIDWLSMLCHSLPKVSFIEAFIAK